MSKKNSPAQLRQAATIILVREKNQCIETYLLKRSAASKFMGGVYVFPGGVVDPEDKGFNSWAPHIDIDLDHIENHLGKAVFSSEENLGFCIAGIRETLEEAGVLMASGRDKSIKDIKNMAAFRLREDLSRSWFKDKVMEEQWTLSLSHLKKWAHWVTPERMKIRFDTLFFIAFMPDGQQCIPDDKETEKGIWISPKKALEKNLENEIPLSPPTITCLTQLLNFSDLNALAQDLDSRPWPEAITPRAVKASMGHVVLMPWDPLYETAAQITAIDTPKKILAPGEKFSRVWNNKGAWMPVGV